MIFLTSKELQINSALFESMLIYFIYRNSSETEVVFKDIKLIGKNPESFTCRLGPSSKILKCKNISAEFLKEEENALEGILGLDLCVMEFGIIQGILFE